MIESVNAQREVKDVSLETHGLVLSPPEKVSGVICSEVTPEMMTEELIETTRKMLRFLADTGAVGLAAPQIGIPLRFFVYWDPRMENTPHVCYNPIYYKAGPDVVYVERCLTYGDLEFAVKRYKSIQAVWREWDVDIKTFVKMAKPLSKFQAEIFQHETDHLDGITIATKGEQLISVQQK